MPVLDRSQPIAAQTALAVIPKNELALVAKREGARVDRLGNVGVCVGIETLSGPAMAFAGLVALPFAPVVAPIMAIVGTVSACSGGIIIAVIDRWREKAKKRQKDASEKRAERLIATAKMAINAVIADDTIRKGLELRIEPQDETPKKVRVKNMGMEIGADGGNELKINAWILEEDGTLVGWMPEHPTNINEPTISFDQPVGALPKAIRESVIQDQRAVAAYVLATLPLPVRNRTPDKILPRIAP